MGAKISDVDDARYRPSRRHPSSSELKASRVQGLLTCRVVILLQKEAFPRALAQWDTSLEHLACHRG